MSTIHSKQERIVALFQNREIRQLLADITDGNDNEDEMEHEQRDAHEQEHFFTEVKDLSGAGGASLVVHVDLEDQEDEHPS